MFPTPGNDTLEGSSGNDTIDGLGGNDLIKSFDGNDSINGGDGNDTLNAGLGVDTVNGGAGTDVLVVDYSSRSTDITQSSTSIQTSGNQTNYSNIEQFNITGGSGKDDLVGGALADTLNGGVGNDTLDGGAGNDILNAGLGLADTVDGGAGTDVLVVDYSSRSTDITQSSTSIQTSGNQTNYSNIEQFNITGGSGKDDLVGGALADTLNGGVGNDTLDGGAGNDILNAGLGLADTVNGGAGTDVLVVNYSSRTTNITQSSTFIQTSGNQTNYSNIEQFNITGGSGNDDLFGGALADTLNGGAGNDTLSGGAGNDVLIGGKGDDYLNSRGGADTYRYTLGDGNDTLNDDEISGGNIDQVIFSGTGLTAGNAIVTRLGTSSDLKIAFGGVTGSIILEDQVYSSYDYDYGVEKITFTDGTIWNEAQLRNAYLTLGAATNDRLEGTSIANTLIGGKGDDYLNGRGGADTYRYTLGDGNDTLNDDESSGGNIDQVIFSGTGLTAGNAIVTRLGTSSDLKIAFGGVTGSIILEDQVYSSYDYDYGVEKITFTDGTIWNEAQLRNAYLTLGAATNDRLEGTSIANTLIGGKGDDYLNGRGGADTYRYTLGDGNDTLKDDEISGGNIDQLIFSGTGLTAGNAIVTRLGTSDDLKIAFGGVTGSIILEDQVYSSYDYDYGVEKITFTDGTIWNEAQLRNAYLTLGAATNDRLEGTSIANTLIGGKGDDYLNGRGGADTYRYTLGDGNDTLNDDESSGGNIDQVIFSGTGLTAGNAIVTRLGTSSDLKIAFGGVTGSIILEDQVYSSYDYDYGVEKITFTDGTIWNEAQLRNAYLTLGAATNDRLEGTSIANTLIGGKGDDYLNGRGGADTYRYTLGDGNDTLNDDESSGGNIDQVIFSGTGLTAGNAIVTRLGTSSDLKIAFDGVTGSIILEDQVYSSYDYDYGVEKITFTDGTIWNEAQLRNAYLTLGAATNDRLEGTSIANTLIGGKGDDYLNGRGGADTYRYTLGDGNDTLNDDESSGGNIDQVIFSGTGLTAGNAIVTRLGTSSDLKIAFGGVTGSIILEDQIYGSYDYGVEKITFTDGTIWNEAQLRNAYLG